MESVPQSKSRATSKVTISGAVPKMGKKRSVLNCAPGDKYTVKRGEAKAAENVYLTDLFCEWLNGIRNEDEPELNTEDFIEQLSDGVMLCRILSELDPKRGTLKYHKTANNIFKKQENLALFERYAIDFLRFPVCFDPSDFRDRNSSKILSCLLYVAKVAEKNNTFETALPEDLKLKVDEQPDIAELSWWEWMVTILAKGYKELILEPIQRATGATPDDEPEAEKPRRKSSSGSRESRRSTSSK